MTNFDDRSNDDLDDQALDQDEKNEAEAELLKKLISGDEAATAAYIKPILDNHLLAYQPGYIAVFAKVKQGNVSAWLRLKPRLQQNKKLSISAVEKLIKEMIAQQRPAGPASASGDERRQSGCEMRLDGNRPGLHSTEEDGLWLAQVFEVSGLCRVLAPEGETPRACGVLIRFKNSDAKDVDLFINSELLNGEFGRLGTALYEAGFIFDRGDAYRKMLHRYLANYSCSRRVTVVARTGWIEVGGRLVGFILPNETFLTERFSAPLILDPAARTARYLKRGSLEEWRNGAGRLAGQHALATFRMSSALSGPLLKLTGYEGGGFHLFGPSSGGKSTLDILAMTVWGRGDREGGFGRTWSATANGVEAAAASSNDTALFLDDTSHADPKIVLQIIYTLTGGQQKIRMRADTSQRETPPFRSNVLSNGEKSIPDTLKDARLPVKGGVTVRLADIAAIGRGKLDPNEQGAAFDDSATDWRAFVAEAARAAMTAYGTAGPAFVQKLIDEKISGADIRARVDDFIKLAGVGQAHGQVRRVAMKAGLSAVAGELAIAFGIVPWASGSAVAAAEYVFQLWLERRGTRDSYELMEALQRVQAIFEQYGDSRFDPLRAVTAEDPAGPFDPVSADFVPGIVDLVRFDSGRSPTLKRLGWTSGVGEDRRWYIAPQTWKDEICKGFDVNALTSELDKKGALELSLEKDGDRLRKRPKKVGIGGLRPKPRYYIVTPRVFQVVSDLSEEGPMRERIFSI